MHKPLTASRLGTALVRAVGGLCLGALGCSQASHFSEDPTGQVAAGEIQRYEYEFDVRTGVARTTLDIRRSTSGSCFALANRSQILSALWNGEPAEVFVRDRQVFICGRESGSGPLRLETEQEPKPGTLSGASVGVFRKEELAGTFTYLSSWIEECDRLGPCDTEPSRQASFQITVRHEDEQIALCPGAMRRIAGGTRCEIEGTLAPAYSALALIVRSGWHRSELLKGPQSRLVLYDSVDGRIGQALRAEDVGPFMEWAQGLLGPLPYGEELRIVSAPTSWLGFEHPANIVLREDLDTQRELYENPVLHTFMHEVFHQWAGNRTTIQSAMDFAWKEGIAEYLTYVYEEERRPPAESIKTRASWARIALLAALFPRPIPAEPASVPPLESLAVDSYGTGPMLLFLQLEPIVGRAAIMHALGDFLREPGARSIADLQARIEHAAGTSLTSYFDAWVYGDGEPEWPAFKVDAAQEAGLLTLTVTQQAPRSTPFPCVVEVDAVTDTERVQFSVPFVQGSNEWSVRISQPFGSAPFQLELDPRQRLVNRRRR